MRKSEFFMTRLGKLFFGLLVVVLLLWQVPWAVNYLAAKRNATPFTLYSEVLNDFALIRRDNGGIEYADRRGNRYEQRQFDSLLPLFYARQLVADGRFPDSIGGRAVSPREAQAATFVFRSTPQGVNTPAPGIRFLLESMSGRVDLAMPADAFRLTDDGIEFIDMASNRVDRQKSARFTEVMRRKGVRFPVTELSGNPTTRKEYDEGYVLLDADRRMFHLKMVQGRPYVRAIALPEGVRPEHLFITEYHSRRTLALLTDDRARLYAVCMPGYEVRRVEGVSYDPERESISIIGTLLHWTVCVEGDSAERCYAVAADNLALLDTLSYPLSGRHLPGLAFTSSQDNYVRPRLR